MTPAELQAYLHAHIPLSAAMQVAVDVATPEQVVLGAPLAPNINHRDTVFGGSASALSILAAWSLVHLRLAETRLRYRLVIQRNTMSYDAPIAGDFTATGRLADGADWERMVETLERRGKARIRAIAELGYGGAVAGRLEAEFVALLER